MFYSQVILTRKGPLGKIWLAAHFDKKLSKNQIFTTDITNTVDTVLSPNAHLALKVSGHLMLGIVRIYSKKVKYLMIDCTEAMWKMKLAFKPGKVDIDSAVLQLGIDDNRHYGNLMADEGDILGLESFVFGTQLPTLTVSRLGYLDDDSVFTDFSNDVRGKSMNSSTYERSIMSEIEDVRGASRSSVDSARTPLEVLDVKRGSFTGLQLDEDLPGFEDDMNVVFSQPNLLIDHRAEHIETTDFFHEVPITTAPLKYAETSDIKSKKPSIRLPMPLKKRRVQLDDKIEFSDKQFRQRVADPQVYVRRVLPLATHFRGFPFKSETDTVQIYHSGICNELAEIYKVAQDSVPLPFPLKKPRNRGRENPSFVEEPETVRRSSSDVAIQERSLEPSLSSFAEQRDGQKSFLSPAPASNNSDLQFDFDTANDGIFEPIFISPVEGRRSEEQGTACKEEVTMVLAKKQRLTTLLQAQLKNQSVIDTKSLFQGLNKSRASRCFLELLQLKADNLIHIDQRNPYDPIQISTKQS